MAGYMTFDMPLRGDTPSPCKITLGLVNCKDVLKQGHLVAWDVDKTHFNKSDKELLNKNNLTIVDCRLSLEIFKQSQTALQN